MTDTFPLTDAQVLAFADGDEDIADENHEALYTFYTSSAAGDDAMPYGTAKARTGDPYHFIAEKLEERAAAIVRSNGAVISVSEVLNNAR